MIFRLITILLITTSFVSAQHSDSTKRPLLTLLVRVPPPWLIAGGVEVYAFPRHSITATFGYGLYYIGLSSADPDIEKFKIFDYRFYFGLTKKKQSRNFFLSPSLRISKREFEEDEGFAQPYWMDDTADDRTVSLLVGKRKCFDNNLNFEFFLGPAYTTRSTLERKYDETQNDYIYNTYESSFWKLRVGFSVGCTFFTKRKKV